jgi:hypothetical protein
LQNPHVIMECDNSFPPLTRRRLGRTSTKIPL